MPNDWFKFRQFIVKQDRCAMKVGTDGVLLGSWCDAGNSSNILDAGTGTGLIALICAQRSQASVTGIEIDPAAACQARENFQASPWKDRLGLITGDIRETELFRDVKYDLVVSNPPYYEESLLGKNNDRNIARHGIKISLNDLIDSIIKILEPGGKISLIIPSSRDHEIRKKMSECGFYPDRYAMVASRPGDRVIRVMSEWTMQEKEINSERIYIYKAGSNELHPLYRNLTGDFYL